MKAKKRETIAAGIFLMPAVICLVLFNLFPIIRNFFLSFTSWDMVTGQPRFIFLDNYIELFSGQEFYHSIGVTLIYTVLFVFGSMSIGLVLSLLLTRNTVINKILRTVFFTPTVTSMVAMSAVWLFIYHPQYGSLNTLLGLIGIAPIRWLNEPSTALVSLVIMNIWKRMGFCSVVYLGAIMNIPESITEASEIDGANARQRFRHVQFPMISHATFMLFIIMTIESFQVFTQIDVMTEGGPNRATTNLLTYMFTEAFSNFRVGYGSAISTVLLLIVLTIYFFQSKFEKKVNYDFA